MMKTVHAPYSWRTDPTIPAFEDNGLIAVMDAHCALCALGARWIARNDSDRKFQIIPLQSKRGKALMRHFGMEPNDPMSWLYLEDGQAYSSLDAIIRTGKKLGGIWRFLALLQPLPKPFRDWLYGFVARNRYRWFGRADLCALPDPEVQRRLLL